MKFTDRLLYRLRRAALTGSGYDADTGVDALLAAAIILGRVHGRSDAFMRQALERVLTGREYASLVGTKQEPSGG